jgi:aspartyl-tRNA(Asn)/glutamyl-tRNA(Gln) amidotransferase subunit A
MSDYPLTIQDAAARLGSGNLTSVALVEHMIDEADRLDPILGVFLRRFNDAALAAAREADLEREAGNARGPLHGIPFGIKDILAAREGPTTGQSLVTSRTWGPGRDALAVARLRDAGGVILGKTTTMEFAMGRPDFSKPLPIPRNPWNLDHWTGGSSSGTANGVAAGLFLGGLGTDTGGSIRTPAAYCGISGLKATYGRVPKSGCIPLGFTLDHVGPMARSAWDCAAMLNSLAGSDSSDPASATFPVTDYLTGLEDGIRGLRVGVERAHHFPPEADSRLAQTFDAALAELESLGARLTDVSLPLYDQARAATMLSSFAEGLAYHRSDLRQYWNDYFAGSRQTVSRGAFMSGADYVQAQRVRRVVQAALHELFETVDVIVMPTAAVAAPRLDAGIADITAERARRNSFTPYWNAVGYPTLVVPMGQAANGLPLSVQIAGRPFDEVTILRTGHTYQKVTDWHLRVPPLQRVSRQRQPMATLPKAIEPASPATRASLELMLLRAGLAPGAGELDSFAPFYELQQEWIDSLYAVDGTRDAEPALIFEAEPLLTAWS